MVYSSVALANDAVRLDLSGISEKPLQNVQKKLDELQESYPSLSTESNLQSFLQAAPNTIQTALEPFGYFRSTISSSLEQASHEKIIHFTITKGPQLKITSMQVTVVGEGQDNDALKNFIQHFPLKSHDPLLIEQYNKALDTFFQLAQNQGYLKASYTKKEIRINLKNYTADIILILNTGSRYYFGNVQFSKSPFAPSFLQKFVQFHPTEPFSSEKLLTFQQNLAGSQYFQQVAVNPLFDQTTDLHVPIQVDTIPRKAQQYNIGLGWGTFTGPRFTAGFDWRHTTNTGQHFNMELKLSPVISGLAAKYFIPGKNPLTDQYTLGANFQQFQPSNGRSFSETLSGSFIKSKTAWQHTTSLNYLRERFSISDEPWSSSSLLYPSFRLSHVKSDSIINIHEGHMLTWTLQGADADIFSHVSFIQSQLSAKWITSPTEASRIILRGDLGYTVVKQLDKLPLSLQFFAGGPNSVRGYRYDNVGPGRYLKVGSAEYQHRIIGEWYGAVFYDAGIASDHANAAAERSHGIGVVYHSVIGPIKLYLARAENSYGKPLRVDFTIGSDF